MPANSRWDLIRRLRVNAHVTQKRQCRNSTTFCPSFLPFFFFFVCFRWRPLCYKLFQFFCSLYTYHLLVTSLLNLDVPVVYLFLMHVFSYKTSTPFILRHHLGSVLIGHCCIQVFRMENTQRASSSLVGKGLLVFRLSDLPVLRCKTTDFFVLFNLAL